MFRLDYILIKINNNNIRELITPLYTW